MKPKLLVLSILIMSLTTHATAQESSFERFGLHVAVSNLDRSREFYEKIFQKSPYVKNERLMGFDIAGGLFALFAEQGNERKVVQGNNVVPYLRVQDAEREFQRIKALSIPLLDEKVVVEGPIKLFRFADPDGNVIEFFSLATAPPR